MAAKSAEKLIILGDVCKGLLARAFNLTGNFFRRPETLNADVEKVCKILVRKFPEHPSSLDQAQGHETFAKRAVEISSQLKDYYMTFLDILSFDAAAWELLTTMSKTIVTFKYDVNVDLMTHFMDLFVGYTQLHLLVSRVNDSKLMLSAYAHAYQLTQGNTEPEFGSIARYIQEYEDPVKALRTKCTALSACVGETLVSFVMQVSQWFDPKALMQKGVFKILDDPSKMAVATHVQSHLELMHLDRLQLWTLYGFLMCPAELQKESAFLLLQTCLKSHFVVPIYREQMLDIWEEYDRMFSSFKINKFKLSKHKKIIKEAFADAIPCVLRHEAVRKYLRSEMTTLMHFFSEFPQLVAPKFQMILCLLHLVNVEVTWYFRHYGRQPHKQKKFVKPDDYKDRVISEFIFLSDRLANLIRDNEKAINDYHVVHLRTIDSQNIRKIAENFVRTVKLSHGMQEILGEIVNVLSGASIGDDFEAMRLNWYRVSASLNSHQSGIGQKAGQLNAAMTPVLAYSRNVDRVKAQLRSHASFKNLFWYRKMLHQILMDGLSGTQGQPRHCMAILRVLHQGLENVHRFCPEEQKLIGTKAVATAELFFNAIITALASLLSGITIKISSLHQQISALEVVHRAQRAPQYAKRGGREPLPGYESLFANRSVVNSLRVWKKSVADICAAVRETDRVVIFNTEFVPKEWLYESVSKAIRGAIVRVALPEKTIARPSQLLSQVKDIISAFQNIDQHVNVNLSEIVREILFTEFSDLRLGVAGSPINLQAGDESKSKGGPVLIHALASWYQNLLQASLKAMGITYSPVHQGFVTMKHFRANTKFLAERFADKQELKDLCVLAGPYGVRCIDKVMLQQVSKHVESIRKVLIANGKVLNTMKNHFPERLFWLQNIKQLRDMDKMVVHSIVVGCVLKFRRLLHDALREVLEENTRFVFDAVRLVHAVAPKNTVPNPKLASLDFLAHDCGINMESADHNLRLALKKFKQTQQDDKFWSLLPELFGASVALTSSWKDATYLVATESHTNNAHCMATTITSLIGAFKGILVDTSSNPNVENEINADLKSAVENISFSVLHMASPHLRSEFSSYHNNIPHMMMFIEQLVVEAQPRLDLAMLEECFPFTLLRTTYVQMYEKQDTQGTSFQAVVDEDEKTEQSVTH